MNNEQLLIRQLHEGQPKALETVVRLHHQFLVAMTTPLVGVHHAEDAAQETWLKAIAAIRQFEGRSKLRTWLARIAINEANAIRRKQQRETMLYPQDLLLEPSTKPRFYSSTTFTPHSPLWHDDSPDKLLTEIELNKCIRQHIQSLPDDQSSVIIMRELGGLEFYEIAKAMGLGEGNIRVLLHRGRQRIQSMINNFHEVGTC